MPKPLQTPERLFDRTWRPGHPFQQRLSGRRRWGMIAIFVLLCAIIAGYGFLTDSNRVREMAEKYLSDTLGGRVQIGQATLSIFEGLRLDDVRLQVGDPRSPDAQLFSAATFLVEYSPKALLRGKVDARRIVAIDPRVTLTENLDTHLWNYNLLSKTTTATRPTTGPIPTLPEVVLRNAQFDYNQIHGGRFDRIGTINVEGIVTPDLAARVYRFQFQSRGKSQNLGPSVDGTVAMDSGKVDASLHDVEFGPDIQVMLPAQVRTFWRDHGLSGPGIKLATISYDWRKLPDRPFDVKIQLEGVRLTVQPQELIGREEIELRARMTQTMQGLRDLAFADLTMLETVLKPTQLAMENVRGDFAFTNDRIELRKVLVNVAGNELEINGHLDGYSPDAAATIDLVSTRHLTIPARPAYINSTPPAIREIYSNFRPQGTGEVWVKYVRPAAGEAPQVTAEISILDGQFTFDKFPYPVRNATGKIAVDRDAQTGQERLRFVKLRGRGIKDSPNENCTVEINGEMGPFTSSMGVRVVVRGENIASEPALNDAFPARTRQALHLFDAEGKGEFPKYHGSFVCTIVRFPEAKSRWSVVTDIKLDDAAGSLVAFPYAMSGVRGEIKVMDDHLEILRASMSRGDATLDVSGRVDWRTPTPSEDPRAPVVKAAGPSLRPDLKLSARNVPIDKDLLNALPDQERQWLTKMSAAGRFDLDGTLSRRADSSKGDLDFDFGVVLHQCAFGTEPIVSAVDGQIRLMPQRMEMKKLTGKRGAADISASGTISWPTHPPIIDVIAQANNLALDRGLYELLSEASRRGWDQVRPQGTVDATIAYKGRIGPTTAPTTAPTTEPTTDDLAYEILIKPRSLTATPVAAPYRMEQVAGTATITPGKVTLANITAGHGDANIRLSGEGVLGRGGAWSFQLAGDHMLVDDDLRRAVPSVLQSLLQSSQMQGQVAFDFSKLTVAPSSSPPVTVSRNPVTGEQEAPVDIAFDVKLWAQDASLNTGVPLSKVTGTAHVSGETRAGHLAAFNGSFDAPALVIADRPATNFRADIAKRPESQAMTLYNMQAQVSGGALAGQVDWISPDNAPARYAMSIVLRNADMRQLTGDPTPELRGQASASLALEGNWDDPNSRRGGGDVTVVGQEMYKIPIVLGLLQITNLALPTTSPFSEANVRYSVDGGRVTFETIELRSKEMLMQGSGHLDFATRKVRLDFITAAQNWPKIPIIGDLLQGARNELLTIHVRGTLQDPKVSATSMTTLTTTVDEVFKGNAPPEEAPPKKKK